MIVSHAGQTRVVDFSEKTSNYELQYAAFYADCEHEVRPVTDGYRVCLVYNLSTGGRNRQPAAPEFSDAVESAAEVIREIFEEDDQRDMIVLPLLHQYTEAGLAPEASADVSTDEDAWDDDAWGDGEWDEDEEDDSSDEVAGVARAKLVTCWVPLASCQC